MTTQATFPRSVARISSAAIHKTPYVPQPLRSIVAWVTLIGIFFPPLLISLGDINVTPGRFVVILLFFPALGALLKSGRKGVSLPTSLLLPCAFGCSGRPP